MTRGYKLPAEPDRLENKTGITMYLSGHRDKSKLIQKSSENNNLDIVLAGLIPPNPFELLTRTELNDFIAE